MKCLICGGVNGARGNPNFCARQVSFVQPNLKIRVLRPGALEGNRERVDARRGLRDIGRSGSSNPLGHHRERVGERPRCKRCCCLGSHITEEAVTGNIGRGFRRNVEAQQGHSLRNQQVRLFHRIHVEMIASGSNLGHSREIVHVGCDLCIRGRDGIDSEVDPCCAIRRASRAAMGNRHDTVSREGKRQIGQPVVIPCPERHPCRPDALFFNWPPGIWRSHEEPSAFRSNRWRRGPSGNMSMGCHPINDASKRQIGRRRPCKGTGRHGRQHHEKHQTVQTSSHVITLKRNVPPARPELYTRAELVETGSNHTSPMCPPFDEVAATRST